MEVETRKWDKESRDAMYHVTVVALFHRELPWAVRGHQVYSVRSFSRKAARRTHDPVSFTGERKVEEFICPAPTFYLLG